VRGWPLICADVGAPLATHVRARTNRARPGLSLDYFDVQACCNCAREQMKPPADVLATAAGKEQWDAKKTTCGRTSAKSDKWNKHLGADKTFEDLPLMPPDYDWSFDVCCCGTLYTYSAKNPDPEAGTTQPSQAVAGQQPPPQPQIQGQAPAASSSSSQHMPPGWKAVKDPATGKTYYQNDITKQTQWEKPSAQR